MRLRSAVIGLSMSVAFLGADAAQGTDATQINLFGNTVQSENGQQAPPRARHRAREPGAVSPASHPLSAI
jgi:hypothetical protein